MKLISIGYGNMGSAILDGAAAGGIFSPSEIGVFDTFDGAVQKAKAKGFAVLDSERACRECAEILLLAVKPQGFPALVKELKGVKNTPEGQVLVTIAAGISSQSLQNALGDVKVVRVMPNTPLLIGEGATALCRTANVTDDEFEKIISLFAKMGATAVISEELMDAVIPANGSTPAFVYYFIKCLADSCERLGIERETATKLLCQSFIGGAKMVLETGESLDKLIQNVCSPGGATLEAIKAFDEGGLAKIIDDGAVKCVSRARQLGIPLE